MPAEPAGREGVPEAPRRSGGHPARQRGPLGVLADDIASRKAQAPAGASWPELPALEEFRALWSSLRTGSQVRRSLAQVPDDAGPLNSARLVHRALTLMRTLSPAYLQHFLAYADTLSWLDTLREAGVLGTDAPTPTASAGGKPRARAKAKAKAKPRSGEPDAPGPDAPA